MALTDADKREIADLIREELDRSGDQAGGEAGQQYYETALQEATARAAAPLAGTVGNWQLASAGTGSQEAGALDAPVEFDHFENNLHAGGRVMITNFRGRLRQGVEAGAALQQGQRFGGTLVLAYDAPNNQYIELYADDLGKVTLSTTENWEVDGETLRLYHDDYVAEYGAKGSQQFRFNLYEARRDRRGKSGTEARGAPIKSATMKRQ